MFLKECEWRLNTGSPQKLLKDLKSTLKSQSWVSAPMILAVSNLMAEPFLMVCKTPIKSRISALKVQLLSLA